MYPSHPLNKCNLCGHLKPLLAKSHIIPEFMYSSLFDEHHKLNKFAPFEYVSGTKRITRPSSGEYDSNILCQKCDNEVLGQYESYASKALYQNQPQPFGMVLSEHGHTRTGMPVTRLSNLRYKEFKLFLLSILWRASVSSRPFFNEILLGPYESRIGQMILKGDPGEVADFPILLLSFKFDKSMPYNFVARPGIYKDEKGVRYLFWIAGFTYVFYISPGSIQPEYMPFTILPSNNFSVLYIPDGKGQSMFNNYFKITRAAT